LARFVCKPCGVAFRDKTEMMDHNETLHKITAEEEFLTRFC
jgi:hypothetical protein